MLLKDGSGQVLRVGQCQELLLLLQMLIINLYFCGLTLLLFLK